MVIDAEYQKAVDLVIKCNNLIKEIKELEGECERQQKNIADLQKSDFGQYRIMETFSIGKEEVISMLKTRIAEYTQRIEYCKGELNKLLKNSL
jgi:prefoldin subunit 5